MNFNLFFSIFQIGHFALNPVFCAEEEEAQQSQKEHQNILVKEMPLFALQKLISF
jgi:hypothetical protein